MNAQEFVSYWKKEKESSIELYFSGSENTAVSSLIEDLELDEDKKEILKKAFDQALTDTYYTLLLGLDGAASIGGLQHIFSIYDEEKNLISECGDLEAEAYTQFQEQET